MAALRQFIYGYQAESTIGQIRTQVFRKTINLPISWFERPENQPEIITSKLTANCRAVHHFTGRYIAHTIIILASVTLSVIGSIVF
jgi:ABC-type multidrug transport system fused ATPase/permease subunit